MALQYFRSLLQDFSSIRVKPVDHNDRKGYRYVKMGDQIYAVIFDGTSTIKTIEASLLSNSELAKIIKEKETKILHNPDRWIDIILD